jgi:hypothetical protein
LLLILIWGDGGLPRHAQCLPDEYQQPFAPRNPGITGFGRAAATQDQTISARQRFCSGKNEIIIDR